MKMFARLASTIVLAGLFSACDSTKPVKQVRWRDFTFQLAVLEGGALTSDVWEVTARCPGILGENKQLLFEAYKGPDLLDIQINGNFLTLFTEDYPGKPKQIKLNLRHINALLQSPIRYQRYELIQSNAAYLEPDFIKAARRFERAIR